jgi:hypothetical protein
MSDSDTVETKKRGRPAAREVPEKVMPFGIY